MTRSSGRKAPKRQPNPAGRHGKPIVLPPISFEDAVRRAVNTPAPSKQASQKKTAKKR